MRVLTMEYIQGIKASDVERLREQGLDPREVARRGADAIMKQVFVHGFFHADPHPGNIFVLPDNVICFLDFGMMGRIDRETREHFSDLLMAIVQRDESKVADVLLYLLDFAEEPDLSELRRDVGDFMERHLYRPLNEIELGKVLQQLLKLASIHGLRIPPDLFLMMKALSTIDGLGRLLDSDLDIVAHAAPFVRRIQMNRLDPRRTTADIARSGTQLLGLLKDAPRDLQKILELVKRGEVKVEIEHKGLGPLLASYDRVSNRLAFAVVLASLVIGSALIILSGVPPTWNEIPVIGLVGFLISGVMGLWLLFSILRHGRM